MKSQISQFVAIGTAATGIALAVTLLSVHLVSEATFLIVLTIAALSALAIYLSPRLLEFNLKEMKLVLDRIERVKADIDAMYGETENLKRPTMKNDNEWHERMGAGGGLVMVGAVMNYVSGCIKRERERLAQVFILGNSPEKTATALVDHTKDDLVFKWEPGSVSLDKPPRSVEDRKRAAEASKKASKADIARK